MSPSSWTSKTFRLAILAGYSFQVVDTVWQPAKFTFIKGTEPHLVQATFRHVKVGTFSPFLGPLFPSYSTLNITPFIYLALIL